MKNTYLSVSILVFIFSLLFLCCNKVNETGNIPLTEAEQVIVSSEYQNFSQEAKYFSQKIYQRLSTLSEEEKEKLDKISSKIKKIENSDQIIALILELQELMGIDYVEHAQKIQKLSENLFKNHELTLDEITKAIYKDQFLNKVALPTKTQVEFLSESITPVEPDSTSTTPSPDLLEVCIQGCQNSYQVAAIRCPSHGHKTENEKEICGLERLTVLTICIENCKKNNSSTPPSTI